jgi:ABC-type nitrate/sulfonate/bicarbonate transport system ATPase subunit
MIHAVNRYVEPENAVSSIRSAPPALAVRGLAKSFHSTDGTETMRALGGVDLSVEDGRFVCLLGPSGCGKTTLIRIVSGLLQSDAGEVLVAGNKRYLPGTDVCMVFQNHGLFPWLTAIENIEYGLKVRGVARKERRDVATHYLELVGLQNAAKRFPHQLSGGMQQRIGIARALACRPKLLLMDEPFAAVDAQTREHLQHELLDLWQRDRLSVVFVTHSIDEAVYLGDRVVVMASGPGRIQYEQKIALDRPRDRESPEYVAITKTLRQQLALASQGGKN